MSGAPSPLKWRVVARTPPTFTSTCSFTSPASQSTATTGSLSTSLLSTTPTTGTTRRLLLLILTGPGAMSPTRQLSPGTCAVPSTTRPSPLMVMATVTATVSTTGAKVARDSASMVSPTWPGPSPGRDTLACTSSLASPRVWSTLSSILCLRVSPSSASGGDRTVTTGPPPTMSGMKALTSTREFSSSAAVSPPPPPRVTVTSGTEAPSSLNSTTATSTAATGRWTSTSENPPPRCPPLTWSSSGPRPGPPSLTTGTSMRERRLRNPPTTNLLRRSCQKCQKCHFLAFFLFFFQKKTCFSLIFGDLTPYSMKSTEPTPVPTKRPSAS